MPKTKAKPAKSVKVGKSRSKSVTPDWLRKAMKPAPKPKTKLKARKGKPMPNISKDKPLPDPFDDPDLRAGEAKPNARLEGDDKPPKATKLVEEREEEVAPLFDEVQSGAEIPPENVETLIAGTLGGSGDAHANAKRIMRRMYEAPPAGAGWQIIKALDAGTGDTRKAKGWGKEDEAPEARKAREAREAEARKAATAKEAEDAKRAKS